MTHYRDQGAQLVAVLAELTPSSRRTRTLNAGGFVHTLGFSSSGPSIRERATARGQAGPVTPGCSFHTAESIHLGCALVTSQIRHHHCPKAYNHLTAPPREQHRGCGLALWRQPRSSEQGGAGLKVCASATGWLCTGFDQNWVWVQGTEHSWWPQGPILWL